MPCCTACGSDIAPTDAYCVRCGSKQAASRSSSEGALDTVVGAQVSEDSPAKFRVQASRVAAGVWIIAATTWIVLSDSPLAWALLLTPSVVACIWPLARHAGLTAWAERREGQLRIRLTKTEAKAGKVAKYFSIPLYRGCLFIWRKTQAVEDRHLRAGLRAGAILYFGSGMVFLAAVVGYVIVAGVVVIAVLIFVLWLAGRILSGEQPSMARRTTVSRPAKDFLGYPRTDVFDGGGKKIAEVRPTSDFLGNPKEEIYDASGRKIGERHPSTDILGSPTIDEFNAKGEKTGTSRQGTDLLGDPIEEHFDNAGHKVGESRPETDSLGDPIVKRTTE